MESSSFLPRQSAQLFVAYSPVLQARESWVGGLGMRPGKQDSSTISCIPKPLDLVLDLGMRLGLY